MELQIIDFTWFLGFWVLQNETSNDFYPGFIGTQLHIIYKQYDCQVLQIIILT